MQNFVQFLSIEHKICIFPKILEKLWQQHTLGNYPLKNDTNIIAYCMQNFVRFRAPESKIELPQEFRGKKNRSVFMTPQNV